MSLATAADRIGAIQTMIQELRQVPAAAEPAAASAPASSPVSATSATVFGSVLADVAGGSVTGSDIVEQAKTYLGVPYVFGGEDASGMDCSGLVQRVMADLGIDVPRVVQDQADVGTEVASLAEAQPGDLLVTKGEGHIVIYAGDGKIIHAPRPGKDVQLVDNYLGPEDISTIRRLASSAPAVAAAPAAAATPAAQATPAIDQTQLLSLMQSMFLQQAGGGLFG
ncbi:C40 family peptidase [Microbacterium stercoris]|uniref:C40 family peptidase n=1 Tax=Microbacterium stercoris TaxID=2820289 RepID=A0A939QPY1_9MICO|nr:C40 family peptidase [Microbacterium stercoris]MBO3664600.1 C40 family peptidase [Microbacterium stercoris]